MSDIAKIMTLDPGKLFHLLMDGITDYALFIVDGDGIVNHWSVSAEKIFGFAAKDIQGQSFSCLYPQEGRDRGQPKQELHMAASHGRFEDTGWRLRKDGSLFWANGVLCPLLDDDGALLGFSNITRDMTERKNAEEALRQKEQELFQSRKLEAIGRLAGGVAHDFNNLMAGIMGLSEELCNEFEPNDPKRLDLEEIVKAAGRATTLTRQLLALGRRQVISPQVIHINKVILDMENILSRLVGADLKLKVDVSVSQSLPVKMDPSQLEQILVNLVVNARDATSSGGLITVKTSHVIMEESATEIHDLPPGPYAVMSVEDNGSGMTPYVASKIFEPFFTTKETGKGTGLGLPTVYGIVKQNHGDIRVWSEVSKGTRIEILLPEADEISTEQPATGVTDSNEQHEDTAKATILLVEDEDIVRRTVGRSLRRLGYRVLDANNGQEAIRRYADYRGRVDLLLTDVVMPGMNGRELAQWARRQFPDIGILYMSGYSEDIIVHRGLAEPGMHVLEKTFTRDELAAKIQQVLHDQ